MTEAYDPRARQPHSEPPPGSHPHSNADPYRQQGYGDGQWHDDRRWPADDPWLQDERRQDEWRREQWRQEQWRQEQVRAERPGGGAPYDADPWRGRDPRHGHPGQSGGQPHREDYRAYRPRRRRPDASKWHWLLLLPIIVPLATPLYNRVEPKWLGLPFFYWSQLTFALLASLVMLIVHLATKGGPHDRVR